MSVDIPGYNERQTAELGRQLKRRVGLALDEREKILCRICSTPTPMLGTQLCDRCWELEGRIRRDLPLALKVIFTLTAGDFIDEARQWLRAGAPGKALEVLDAAKERLR